MTTTTTTLTTMTTTTMTAATATMTTTTRLDGWLAGRLVGLLASWLAVSSQLFHCALIAHSTFS